MSDKLLIIMRGVPGAGKSTKVKEIVEKSYEEGFMAVDICSADNYFLRPDGVYDFNPRLLKNAHKWCREMVIKCMTSYDDWGNADLIIVDNTNTRKWEYQHYLELAEKYGYEVEEIVVGEFDKESIQKYAERNTHGVPVEKVREMAERFEK